MIDLEEFAAYLYTTYCKAVGGVAFNGDQLPTWEQFAADPSKEKQANAWREVACRAAHKIDEFKSEQPL